MTPLYFGRGCAAFCVRACSSKRAVRGIHDAVKLVLVQATVSKEAVGKLASSFTRSTFNGSTSIPPHSEPQQEPHLYLFVVGLVGDCCTVCSLQNTDQLVERAHLCWYTRKCCFMRLLAGHVHFVGAKMDVYLYGQQTLSTTTKYIDSAAF